MLCQLADAAKDLADHHSHDTVHGTITPGKILIAADGKAFISGFICFDLLALLHPEYVHPRRDFKTEAPEILRAEVLSRSKQADVFRFGMAMYQVKSSLPYLIAYFLTVNHMHGRSWAE